MRPSNRPLGIRLIEHPLVQHKLTLMREKERSTNSFRSLLSEISILLAYEVTRDLPLAYETIETPSTTMRSPVIDGKKVVIMNILRAGTVMAEGMLQIVEGARQLQGIYGTDRQVKDAEIALVSGHGGNQVCHSTLILGRA